MPVINHKDAPEIPWRPNYQRWRLAGSEEGVSSMLALSEMGPGAAAPLHTHQADEMIVILEGTLEVQLGDEIQSVGADHTLVIPSRVPHGFSVAGEDKVRILSFYPVPDPFSDTTYLKGVPPKAHLH